MVSYIFFGGSKPGLALCEKYETKALGSVSEFDLSVNG